jgi:hypothetical protein
MATNEIQNGCESSIEAVLASNQKRRRDKSVMQRWPDSIAKGAEFAMPVAK